MKIIMLVLLSFPVCAKELKFEKRPDSFFEPFAEFINKDKGLIYIGGDKTGTGTESGGVASIDFYRNKELKGKVAAKFLQEGRVRLYVDDKEICIKEDSSYFKNMPELLRKNPHPFIKCRTEFFILRYVPTNMYYDQQILYNVEIENKESNLISVMLGKEKIFASYSKLGLDYVPPINERRMQFEICLDEALKRGLEEKILKAHECLKEKITQKKRKPYEQCEAEGYSLRPFEADPDTQRNNSVSGFDELGNELTDEQFIEKVYDVAEKEMLSKNVLRAYKPLSCEINDGRIFIKVETANTVLTGCKYDSLSISDKKTYIGYCED